MFPARPLHAPSGGVHRKSLLRRGREKLAARHSAAVGLHLKALEMRRAGATLWDIHDHTGLSLGAISNLVHGRTDPLRTAGRPRLLSTLELATVVDSAAELVNHNVAVTGGDVRAIASSVFSAAHPDSQPHQFGANFVSDARQALPAALKFEGVSFGSSSRTPMMTSGNVRESMKTMKTILNRRRAGLWPLDCVFNLDETDVTPENLFGSGLRVATGAFTLDKKVSCPVLKSYGKHISALCIINPAHGLVHLAFNRAGQPSTSTFCDAVTGETRPVLPNFRMAHLVYSATGSYTADYQNEQGETHQGSFGHELSQFSQRIHDPTHGLGPYDAPLFLTWDGSRIHSHDSHIAALAEDFVVAQTAPGLTSVCQPCDNRHIFGAVKHMIKEELYRIACAGITYTVEQYLELVEHAFMTVVTSAAVTKAFIDCGWCVTSEGMTVNDESIHALVRRLEDADVVRPAEQEVMILREPSYLDALKASREIKDALQERGLLTREATEMLQPSVVAAASRASRIVEAQHYRNVPKAAPRLSFTGWVPPHKKGCVELTEPAVMERMAKKRTEKERRARGKKYQEPGGTVDTYRADRERQLKEALGVSELESHHRHQFGRFLTGTYDFAWVQARLERMKLEEESDESEEMEVDDDESDHEMEVVESVPPPMAASPVEDGRRHRGRPREDQYFIYE